MQLVYKFNIYKHTYIDYKKLVELCYVSGQLYNQALDLIKIGLDTKKYENISTLDTKLKTKEEDNYYKKLKAQCSQQTIKLAQKSWKSYFQSIKEYKKDKSKYNGNPKEPKHKEYYMLCFTNQCATIKDDQIMLDKKLEKINIPPYKDKSFNTFNCIRIIFKKFYIKVEIVYMVKETNENVIENKYASIDLGIDNLCTLVTEHEHPLLIDGKEIKSINQYYNKKKSLLSQNKKFNKNKLEKLYLKRENLIMDKLHKISRYIINYCLSKKIGTLIIGYNSGWKDSINIGKRNNQKFCSIPHQKLINLIKYKCNLVGINFILQEESYTSKCDSLSLEPIKKHENYNGKRIHRGLFKSSMGIINADVNGAINILRKCKGDDLILLNPACIGFLFNPYKIRL